MQKFLRGLTIIAIGLAITACGGSDAVNGDGDGDATDDTTTTDGGGTDATDTDATE